MTLATMRIGKFEIRYVKNNRGLFYDFYETIKRNAMGQNKLFVMEISEKDRAMDFADIFAQSFYRREPFEMKDYYNRKGRFENRINSLPRTIKERV